MRLPMRVIIAVSHVALSPPPDPAAEAFGYPVSIDIRDLISLDDVMTELQLGPNGCVAAVVQADP